MSCVTIPDKNSFVKCEDYLCLDFEITFEVNFFGQSCS